MVALVCQGMGDGFLKQKLKENRETLSGKTTNLLDILADSASNSPPEPYLKAILSETMDAENVLDELEYSIAKRNIRRRNSIERKVRQFLPGTSLISLFFRIRMLFKIVEIRSTLKHIFNKSEKLGLIKPGVDDDLPNEELIKHGTMERPQDTDLALVGRETEVSYLEDALVNPDSGNNLSVVGIVGMGGLGKTCLAQKVYESDKIAGYFDYRMWVTVSDSFEADYILGMMLGSLNPPYIEVSEGETVLQKLQRDLNGKRFLLVLDDVWNENQEKWDCVKRCLLEIRPSIGSKILVTSRLYVVLSVMEESITCKICPLSTDDSWKLFKRIAFEDGEESGNQQVEAIGEWVRMCDGLPLAIKVLGGWLYSRKNNPEWPLIKPSETFDLSDGVLSTLRISYHSLPSSAVRLCFAYCAIFPKDSVIEREKLVQQWMAHGFLDSAVMHHLEMEDVGNYYFDILVEKCFFQDVKKDDFGNIRTCKMHDLVHDFASAISRNFCFSLAAGVAPMPDGIHAAIHLSVISREATLCKIPNGKFRNLRTLHIVGHDLDDIFTSLIHLRVLVVEGLGVTELPTSVGNLKHLRYLDVSKTMICRLPNSITKLHKLQTLRLYAVEEFPKNFNNLINLRHLCIEVLFSDLSSCLIPGISDLVSLQTLPFFVVDGDAGSGIEVLGCLPNLKGDLKIFGLQNIRHQEEALSAKLSEKSSIQSLEFHWDDVAEQSSNAFIWEILIPPSNLKSLAIVNFQFSNFPSWVVDSGSSIFSNLIQFRLENCMCYDIPVVGHLPCLKIVEIYHVSGMRVIGNSFYGSNYLMNSTSSDEPTAFRSLRRFSLSGMSTLEKWFWTEDLPIPIICPEMEELNIGGCPELTRLPDLAKFCSLQRLYISSCKKLANIPEGIGSLASLEYMGISKCHNLLEIPDAMHLVSLRAFSVVDCRKLRHLPNNLDQCISLESVSILSCPALEPEALQVLNRIRKLEIGYFSDELEYFPLPYEIGGTSTYEGSDCGNQHQFGSAYLTSIKLYGWPKLSFLPEKLQYFCALRELTICLFDGLKVLPEWICKIQSLEILELQECRNLMHFPSSEAMGRLTKLQSLKILYCPTLAEGCMKGSRPELSKIFHIPKIFIDNKIFDPETEFTQGTSCETQWRK